MTTAFVLMTAIPPTTGHLELIQYAASVAHEVKIVIVAHDGEPFATERKEAILDASVRCGVTGSILHIDRKLPEDPEAPGFWDMWFGILIGAGYSPSDLIVASEPYGQKLADVTGMRFMPYDIDRAINDVKAERVRDEPLEWFDQILPEFQRHLRTTVTVFGAESTGKTTLSKRVAYRPNHRRSGRWIPEWARPYLENTSTDINIESMTAIWRGQGALQRHARLNLHGKPVLVQDTDLYSTIGYWLLPHWAGTLGKPPDDLYRDAWDLRSDLYIVTRSNIPFEPDPLRYGGHERESDDQYWIDLLDRVGLPYIVLDSADASDRVKTARDAVDKIVDAKVARLAHDREGR